MKYNEIYPTIIGRYVVSDSDDLNRGLAELLYRMRADDINIEASQHSMRGTNGYHTDISVLKKDNKYVKAFHQIISKEVIDYFGKTTGKSIKNAELTSWGMIYGHGAYSEKHTHPKADLAVVYYVKTPLDLPSSDGVLEIQDPRPAARWDINCSNLFFSAKPTEGTGVVFPAWLEHYVTPHYKDSDRIAIATNVFIDYED